ncbi:hypothetical protein EYF80_026829 [Liparis tanakae]|uniref:Uncharacterized protein n=1 Tax=Liparis tanakae TaxID=230148 RepID=A0A4Z2HAV6_9TELE|nr:hypothetical protein EYF80_026829 [Liparis tanakae]
MPLGPGVPGGPSIPGWPRLPSGPFTPATPGTPTFTRKKSQRRKAVKLRSLDQNPETPASQMDQWGLVFQQLPGKKRQQYKNGGDSSRNDTHRFTDRSDGPQLALLSALTLRHPRNALATVHTRQALVMTRTEMS